jgi:hypothetical protein
MAIKLPDPGQFGRAQVDPAPRGARIDPGRPGTGAAEAYTRGGLAISGALERGGNAIARSVAQTGEIGREVTRQAAASGDAMMRAGSRQGAAIAEAGGRMGTAIAAAGTREGEAVTRAGELTARAMNRSGDYWSDATRQAGAAQERGATNLNKGMQELASAMIEVQLHNDRMEAARVSADTRNQLFEHENSFKTRQDYGAMKGDYETGAVNIIKSGAESIRNPALRERFLSNSSEQMTHGKIRVENQAFRVESSTNVAEMRESWEKPGGFYEQVRTAPDEKTRIDIIKQGQGQIAAAREKGYLTPLEAQAENKDFVGKASESWLAGRTPEERIRLLNEAPSSKEQIVDRIIGVESGGRANAKNANSSATGLGQYIKSKWLESIQQHRPDLMQGRSREQILELRNDPALSREIIRKDVDVYENFLKANGVDMPTPGQIYLAHFLGQQGALATIKAAPGTPMTAIVGPDTPGSPIASNRSVLAGKTVDDVQAWGDRKMGGVQRGTGTPIDFIRPDRRDVILRGAESEIVARNQGMANAEDERLEGLMVDAEAGRGPMPPLQAIKENPAFLNAGTHGQTKINKLTRQWDKANTTIDVVTTTRRRMADPMNVFDPTSKDDKDGIEAVFQANGGSKALMEMNPDYVTRSLAPDVATTGIIPKSAKGILMGMTRSDDVKKVTFSMSAMDRIERANPEAFDREMPKAGRDMLKTYRENFQFKSGAEIVEMIRRTEDPATEKARVELRKEGREKAKEISDADLLDYFDPSVFVRGPDAAADGLVQGAMRNRFDDLYADNYVRTNKNESAAREAAFKELKTAYDGSRAATDGTSRMMYRPPEKYYPPVNGSHDWITKQLADDAKPHLQPGDKFATIRADDRTETEIAAIGSTRVASEYDSTETKSRPPSYRMIIVGANGEIRTGPRVAFDPKKATEARAPLFQSARNRALLSDEYRYLDEGNVPFGVQ